jgi:hypothetical protein
MAILSQSASRLFESLGLDPKRLVRAIVDFPLDGIATVYAQYHLSEKDLELLTLLAQEGGLGVVVLDKNNACVEKKNSNL